MNYSYRVGSNCENVIRIIIFWASLIKKI